MNEAAKNIGGGGGEKTRVVNLRREAYDVYIGRASALKHSSEDGYFGNPHQARPGGRDEAIALYRADFFRRVETEPEFRRRVLALRGQRLGCWCAPEKCHGDVIVEWLEQHPETAAGTAAEAE